MIYFDNAATSFPKAPTIQKAFSEYINNYAVNINRSIYSSAYKLEEKIYDVRESVKAFFNADENYETIFSSGITASLNLFINGILKEGDEVIVSPLEHNAVMRPLEHLQKTNGVKVKILPPLTKKGTLENSPDGHKTIEELLEKNITKSTKAVIIVHASNVNGAVNDIYAIGEAVSKINQKRDKKDQIYYAIDTASSGGSLNINAAAAKADYLVFSAHKGLLSLPGTGGAVVKNTLFDVLPSLIFGGTGSRSDSFEMPDNMPDKFEAGTPNIFGILALGESLKYIKEIGLSNIIRAKNNLCKCFINGIQKYNILGSFKLVGVDEAATDTSENSGIVSLVHTSKDLSEIAYSLDKDFGIATRVGLQCAPLAHKTLGTFEGGGTLRFSFSHFNTEEEIETCLKALKTFN